MYNLLISYYFSILFDVIHEKFGLSRFTSLTRWSIVNFVLTGSLTWHKLYRCINNAPTRNKIICNDKVKLAVHTFKLSNCSTICLEIRLNMSLNFEPINLHKQYEYLEHFDRCSQKASDCSVVNLWGWAEEYGLYWAWSDKLVWIKQTVPEELYWAPVGLWDSIDWKKCFSEYFTLRAFNCFSSQHRNWLKPG